MEKDPRAAVNYFMKASKTHADAAFCLGRCYEEGLGVGDADMREALKYYRRAAKLGSKAAPARVKATEKKLRELAAAMWE
jgi:TPR repeat protein